MTTLSNEVTLTHDQQTALEGLMEWFSGPEPTALLTAYAGCGKTFLAGHFINTLYKQYPNIRGILRETLGNTTQPKDVPICVTAPTHQAVKVLKSKMQNKDGISFKTTHAALGLKPKLVDNRTGKQEYHPDYNNQKRPLYGLIVVDECSMIDQNIYAALKREMVQGTKILYIGDPGQIPPVGEDASVVFNKERHNHFELHTIVRQQAGNPVIQLADELRKLPATNSISKTAGFFGIATVPTDEAYEIAVEGFKQDLGSTKVLAYTNRKVAQHNQHIRQRLYGKAAQNAEFIEGELMTTKQPYVPPQDMAWMFSNDAAVSIPNNTDFKVLSYEYGMVVCPEVTMEVEPTEDNISGEVPIEVPAVRLTVLLIDTGEITEIITYDKRDDSIYMGCKGSLLDEAKELRNANTWAEYYNFLSRFAEIEYAYSITVHRSQGSTYQRVVIDDSDIGYNQKPVERMKLYYTAATRTADKLYLT